jgi:hypothetical protein
VNSKSLSSAFLTAMLVSGLILVSTAQFSTVHASTEVMGIISSDTTWTKANSPYTLTGAVGIINGITLTIEPGVTVNLGDNFIQVNGTLKAKGNAIDKIKFNEGGSQTWSGAAIFFTDSSGDWDETPASGSIIENAIINRTPMLIEKASPKISNNTFNCRISTFGGSPLILHNVFKGGDGIVLYDSNEKISGNVFSDTGQAIYVGGANCAPLIENNLIVHNGYGIIVPSSSGTFSPIIRNNTIANNTDAICIAGGGNPSPVIMYNNIYGSRDYNFRLGEIQNNIDATQNWWGTTDTQAIAQKILDYKKDFNLGNVTFVPFLTEPNPQAMPDPSMLAQLPTPTPTPEPTPIPTLTPTPSPIPVPGQSFFFVESNSTVTELFFNSTSSELSFTVSGESGTAGYVKVTIAKSLLSSVQNVKVYFDGSQLNVAITEDADSWLLSFTYMHSTHHVRISLATNAATSLLGTEYWIWMGVVIIIVVISMGLLLYLKKRKH